MAGTGASSPFIKDEPEESQLFGHQNQRFMGGGHQNFNINQASFQYTSGVNPGDLTMGGSGMPMQNGGNFGTSFNSGTYNGGSGQGSNSNQGFSKGISTFGDDELLESLGTMNDPHSHQGGMQYNTYTDDFQQNMYNNGNSALSIDINGYSHTPDGDPVASPFANSSFTHAQFRHIQSPSNVLHSPGSYTGSPLAGSEQIHNGVRQPQRPSLSRVQRKHSGNTEHSSFQSQPIRTTQSHRHQKNLSGQWDQTPSSLTSFPGSDFSPLQGVHPNQQISEILKSGSMPTKLNNGLQSGSAPALQSQEMKRRRRRESHNLVERRRRDNINERIQELSHLVPMHRLEDEKVRKALQNNSPLSPTLAGLSHPPNSMSPPQATSGLAGPGARRATAGNITTGIPIEEKDKGPNKGDILNGAVSWTRDLMWMLHLKLQQQEDLANLIADLGGTFPFEETEDERRMHTELMDSMLKNDGTKFHYSRAPGSGLRVPKHTDVKGDALGGSNNGQLDNSLSPENHSTGDAGQGLGGAGQYWSGHNSGGSGPGSISFKEEDEYGMDLTQ